MTADNEINYPKTIWIYWKQGLETAPPLVLNCINSWKSYNPEWNVIVLNDKTLNDYITVELKPEIFNKLSIAAQSDVIRLHLLAKYGGVWADSTVYCNQSLELWLNEAAPTGFFAFSNPGPDRLISSWFLASHKNGEIVCGLLELVTEFFSNNVLGTRMYGRKWLLFILSKLFNQSTKTTRFWFSFFVTRLLRVYPYFVIHYLFEVLVRDKKYKEIWSTTKTINADEPHLLLHTGLYSNIDDDIKKHIDNQVSPVYKLSWRFDVNMSTKNSIIYYLFNMTNTSR